MKNKERGREGRGGGLNREGVLINFPPLKREGLLERGAYLRGGLNRGFTVGRCQFMNGFESLK